MYATCPQCHHQFFVGPEPSGPLAAARQKAGFSINQAAQRLGVSSQLLGQIEKGKADPRLSTMFKMSELYGQPVETLLNPKAAASPSEDDESEGESNVEED